MLREKSRPKTVDEYIKTAPKESQNKLSEMRKILKISAKGAKEDLKWGMPALSYRRILVVYAGFRNHIGLYPTPSAIKKFSKELKKFKTAKGSIQFPLDKPLPISLIKKITTFRVLESKEKDSRWM